MRTSIQQLRALITDNMTDEELRNAVNENPDNGSYASTICKNCGSFKTSDDGSPFKAILVDQCIYCPRDEDYKLLAGQEKFEKLKNFT